MTAANSMHIRAAHHRRHASAGFSLIEMAMVLIIMTLVLGGLMMPLSAQIEQRNRTETQRTLEDAKEALIGFAIATQRLPCPDIDKDGLEDQSNTNPPQTTCTQNGGLVPYQTLGIERGDSWFNRIGYRVTGAWANRIGTKDGVLGGIDPTDGITIKQGEITVATRGDNPTTTSVESKFLKNLAPNAPAVLISFGKNGYSATGIQGEIRAAVPAANKDETTNADLASNIKFSRVTAGAVAGCSDTVEGKPACEFDDMIVWVSPNILFNRMAVAGRLPPGSTANIEGTLTDTTGNVSTLNGTITWPSPP